VQVLKKAITLNPLNELSYRVLGNTYRAQRKDALALKQFLKARDVEPDNHYVYYNLGHFYWKKERYDEAIAAWQNAQKLAPKAAFYRYFLAVTYLVQGYYQKVEEVYQEALNDGYDPESSQMAPFYSYFGYIQDIQGNKEEAVKSYQIRLEKGRPLLIAILNFCALNDLKRHKEAREFLTKFIEEENDPDRWKVTKARFLLGELSESDLLEEANHPISFLKRDRQCEAYFYMGKAHLLKVTPEDRITVADSSKAREFFKECLKLEKDLFLNFDVRLWANVELMRLEGDRQRTFKN
jgi:tetratricopeptide (TPR) repeat protein